MNKFFEVLKKQKMSAIDVPAQQNMSYLTTSEIEEYGEVYDRVNLELRPNDPIFMKHDVPKNLSLVSHSS
jgi:hypothetical protein